MDTSFNTYVPSFGTVLLNFLPLLLLVWLGLSFFNRMRSDGQNIFSIGKSRAKLYNPDKPKVTFEDVAGLRGTKAELREVIEFLRDPAKFHRLGGKAPKGLLLVGPPGTGKTLIDELDSIGRKRGVGLGGGNDEREQTLNQLLSVRDGFEPNENVIVMAATNRPDVLDPALLAARRDRKEIGQKDIDDARNTSLTAWRSCSAEGRQRSWC